MYTNGSLRTCQILVFLLSCTCAVVVSVAMGWTSRILKGDCVLYSEPKFLTAPNGSLKLMAEISDWGRESDCSFCTFCPVGIVIYCVVSIWFYVFVSDWGTFFTMDKSEWDSLRLRYHSTDQHLLIPSLVSILVVFTLLLADVAIMISGTSVFCENVEQALNPVSTGSERRKCSYLSSVTWLNVHDGDLIYSYLSRAKVSGWILLVSMAVQTALILVRIRRNTRENPQIPVGSDSDFSQSTFSELRVRYRRHHARTPSATSGGSVSIETSSTDDSVYESRRLLATPNGRGVVA